MIKKSAQINKFLNGLDRTHLTIDYLNDNLVFPHISVLNDLKELTVTCKSQTSSNAEATFVIDNSKDISNSVISNVNTNDAVVKNLSKFTPSFKYKRMNEKSDVKLPSCKKKKTGKFTKPQEIAITSSVPTSNQFAALAVDEMEVTDDIILQPTSQSETSKSKDKPPPIIIHLPTNWQTEMESLRTETNTKCFFKLTGEYLKIIPTTIDDFRELQSHFPATGTHYQTLNLKSQRPKKVVLRGLPIETSANTIITDLTYKGFRPVPAVCLKHRISRQPMPLFLVCIEPNPNWTKIYEIKDIDKMYIKVESYHGSRVKQCYRCQQCGHSSITCKPTPLCVHCGDPHVPKDCRLGKNDKPKCANCGGSHPANFRGCEMNEHRQQTYQPSPKTLNQ